MKSSGVLFERATKKLGWHPFPAPMAILSKPHNGRQGCQNCGFCQGYGCEFGAKSSTLAAMIPLAERTGKCEVRPNSYVRKVELNAAGRATGVVYFDAAGKEQLQKAKAVILSCNGAETSRLLLMSKSNQFPQGLANSSGIVGKHLMFNAGAIVAGIYEHPLNEYKGAQVTRIALDWYDSDRQARLLRRRRARRARRHHAPDLLRRQRRLRRGRRTGGRTTSATSSTALRGR